MSSSAAQRTAAAREVFRENCADRAVDDPVKLAKAARIIRAALRRGVLTTDDLARDAEREAS